MARSGFDFDGGLAYALSTCQAIRPHSHGRTNPGSQAPVRRKGRSYGTTTTTYRRKELPFGHFCYGSCLAKDLKASKYSSFLMQELQTTFLLLANPMPC